MATKANKVMELVDVGSIPTYEQAKLGSRFALGVGELIALRRDIKALEERKSKISDKLFEQLAGTGLTKVVCADHTVTLVLDAKRVVINEQKLIDQGIPIDKIAASKDVIPMTPYLRVDVLKRGKKEDK